MSLDTGGDAVVKSNAEIWMNVELSSWEQNAMRTGGEWGGLPEMTTDSSRGTALDFQKYDTFGSRRKYDCFKK